MTGDELFLGVDGGATFCRARLRNAVGDELGFAEGAAANVYVNSDTALHSITTTVEAALRRAGIGADAWSRISAGLGLAGISEPSDGENIAAGFRRFKQVKVVNDAVTACIGAHAGKDGGVIIAGTGTAAVAGIGGRHIIFGGRGFILGDDGSAARIGLDALRAAMRVHDGLLARTPLSTTLLQSFDNDPVSMSKWALHAKPGDFGGYAPGVFAAAAEGDAVAGEIIGAAATALNELARVLVRLGVSSIVLVGGVAAPIRPYLAADVTDLLRDPKLDALDGAIILAGGPAPIFHAPLTLRSDRSGEAASTAK
jgi:glucosamine kinase